MPFAALTFSFIAFAFSCASDGTVCFQLFQDLTQGHATGALDPERACDLTLVCLVGMLLQIFQNALFVQAVPA